MKNSLSVFELLIWTDERRGALGGGGELRSTVFQFLIVSMRKRVSGYYRVTEDETN
jgi:hypothetical protein